MIEGFVVNTYDALNYDIDFPFLEDKRLDNIIYNHYAYKNIIHGCLTEDIYSKSYRCRLNGIEINSKISKKQIKQYSYYVKQMIDRYDGQIHLIIKGVDIFNRLLVDVYIGGKNLCDLLLKISLHDKTVPFVVYHSYKYKNKKY